MERGDTAKSSWHGNLSGKGTDAWLAVPRAGACLPAEEVLHKQRHGAKNTAMFGLSDRPPCTAGSPRRGAAFLFAPSAGNRVLNEMPDPSAAALPTFEQLYGELKRLAHHLRARGDGSTLTTTVLVHEVWLKLGTSGTRDRAHFLRLAARAMRQIVVDNARAAGRDKRDGLKVELCEADALPDATPEQALSLDQAISELETQDAPLAQIAELHLFAGCNFAEIAALTERSERTVYREWRAARAYLGRALYGTEQGAA
jgi:RNA polymerase sigma factor (TIGR02999 family)